MGSIPRPQKVITAFEQYERGSLSREEFESICSEAVRETIEKFEAPGSPVITDGEQTKPSFATYPIHGLSNLNPGGVKIQFADGHVRQLPKLSSGPFRYKTYASSYLQVAKKFARVPIKQAVISPSALSLLYPSDGIHVDDSDRYFVLVPDVNPFESIRSSLISGSFSQSETKTLLGRGPEALATLIQR